MGALSVLLSGCLQPNEFDPTGNEPIGQLDIVEVAGTAIRVAGWAIDPNTTASVNVTVAYLGKNVQVLANGSRPDVAKAHPGFGAAHGFDFTTPSLGKGPGQICVWIENVGPGSRGRLLGCQDVRLTNDNSYGSFESAVATDARRVRLTGWGLDMETPSKSIQVAWRLNDGSWQFQTADVASPAINTFMGVTGKHGFDFEISVPLGTNKVCMLSPKYGRGAFADLGCKTVTNESLTPVGIGDDLLSVKRVKPKTGHPFEFMSRDAGISTTLSDGSVMWFFGDTSDFTSTGALKFFVNNTATWASSSDPATTTDAVRSDRTEPYLSMQPIAPFSQPCPAGWSSVLWPASAVTIPTSPTTDDVLVYFGNVCLGGAWKFGSRGMGLARFTFDRAAPPNAKAVQGQILTQTLFPPSAQYGTAAHFDGTYVNVYQCHIPEDDGQIHWPNDPGYGPCTVARVEPSNAADLSKYRYWTSGVWSDQPSDATGMSLPAASETPDADKQLPPSSFTISLDPFHGYLMVYSPWPGLTGEVMVRRGSTPQGPWSKPEVYKVPGCNDHGGGTARFCYAAASQPKFSTSTTIGIGYFDELVSLGPARGGYLAGTLARRW
ncbi:MAG: hypothetical protein KDB26_12100 [Microthrixaceae bacterium]|nr:hypothetical protein [Microthrixaceae bacterium]